MSFSRKRATGLAGFTLVEVMMASVILVVGFMGMITAVTICSEMLATAQRQTLAAQIISHQIDAQRFVGWSSMPAAGTLSVPIDSQFNNAIASCGLTASTITLSSTTVDIDADSDGITDLKEITFTVTWTKSGTTVAASTPSGSWLNRLAFFRTSAISRTYVRSSTAYFGKYGLNLSDQRS